MERFYTVARCDLGLNIDRSSITFSHGNTNALHATIQYVKILAITITHFSYLEVQSFVDSV